MRIRRYLGTFTLRPLVLAAFVLVFVFYADRYLSFKTTTPMGDGAYSWIYARSLAFDGDLHLANDYQLCGDPWKLGVDYGAGRPANPFYFGSALIWTPLLWIGKHVITIEPAADSSWLAGCAGPLTRFVGWSGVGLSMATLALGYRVARRWASRNASVVGMLAVAFGSPLIAYGTTGWFSSHVGAACGVALALLLWVRATERPESRLRSFLAGVGLGIAALMRPNELAWGAGPALWVVMWMIRDVRMRKVPVAPMLFGLTFLAGAFSILWIQLAVWKTLYGAYWVVPTGRLYVQPWHAHPFLLLFSSRAGLLVFTPLMWLGFLGVLFHGWRSKNSPLGAVLLVSCAASIWISASPIVWAGGYTFSARLLTSLAAPFVATGALFIDRTFTWLRASRRRRRVALAILGLPIFAICWGIGKPLRAPAADVVRGSDLYSIGLKASLDDANNILGNPANLPASLVFAARYRLHPKFFDSVATDGVFGHDFKTTALVGTDTVDLVKPPPHLVVAEGKHSDQGLLAQPGSRVRFLLAVAWPWVTHVAITYIATIDASLTFRVNGFFSRATIKGIVAATSTTTVEFGVPSFGFDSGINEVIIETTAEVTLTSLKLADRETRDTRVK